MKNPHLHVIAIAMLLFLNLVTQAQNRQPERFLVKVFLNSEEEKQNFIKYPFDLATQKIKDYAEVVAGPEDLLKLAEMGLRTEIMPGSNLVPQVTEYPSYEEVIDQLNGLAAAYPDIVMVGTVGYSQRLRLPIPYVKLSDNVTVEEDEPSILFDGMHHAREPVGMLCTMRILQYLLNNYGYGDQVSDWIDNTEIFFIPIINVEGWQYLHDNNLSNPWWRKNQRENNGNTIFQPEVDGVDLNRNYAHNFLLGGSESISSWTYRGPSPFSESETKAKRSLTLQQKFVASITYHSYGEIILYPWSESPRPGDLDLLQEIAGTMANLIRTSNGVALYEPVASGCQVGQSQCWMYGDAGVLEVLIETAAEFIPDRYTGDQVAWDNLDAALYLLNRVQGPGLKGRITDAVTGAPLQAIVSIKQLDNGASKPHTSNQAFGRYYRLLQAGTYTVEVSLLGYFTKTITGVEITEGKLKDLDIQLDPNSTGVEELEIIGADEALNPVIVYPNPFNNELNFLLNIVEPGEHQLRIHNQLGQLIAIPFNGYIPLGSKYIVWNSKNQSMKSVVDGVYYYTLIGPRKIQSGKIFKQ